MSTLAYAALTTERLRSDTGTTEKSAPSGIKTFLDATAALVPAEVLTAHGLLVSYATTTQKNADGVASTVISDVRGLEIAFYALTVIAAGLYLGARFASTKKLERLDFARAAVPAAAFVLWTMLQRSTAFDAVASAFSDSTRSIVPSCSPSCSAASPPCSA